MGLFRVFLAGFLVLLGAYTAVTIANHGMGLVPIFFNDMSQMAWPGQFDLDFSGYLLLSGLWVAWRNQFSAVGLLLAPVAMFGGMMFLTCYLLFLSFRTDGDMRVILLGEARARGR